MILYIRTDLSDTSWLEYILSEFITIQNAKFEFQIVPLGTTTDEKSTLFYTKEKLGKLNWVPNYSNSIVSENLKYIDSRICILENTGDEKNFDIFWNSFVFLTRYEEYLSEKKGKKIQSYSFNHPRKDKESFSLPIVNILFQYLESYIKDRFKTLRFEDTKEMYIEFSHDVDYIKKTIQLRLKQTIFNIIKSLKILLSFSLFWIELKRLFYFLFSTPSYWCFDYWVNLEKKNNIRSIFYIYVKTKTNRGFISWLIDPSYDISNNFELQEKLKHLYEEGFEIGLHGSYKSALDKEQLELEKNILEEILGIKITKTRQHWLRFEEKITPKIHSDLFKFDATLSWNDRMGFRSGIASQHRAYDHENKKPFSHVITPNILMDSNIYDYGITKVNELEKKSLELLQSLDQYKNIYIALSWHQRVCSEDYKWHFIYEKFLNWYSKKR